MTSEELLDKLEYIQRMKCEGQTLELKAAEKGCPKRLYDTLSSFSNQDEGGIIIFGIDEAQGYEEVGVYDPQEIKKKINEQCLQMEPSVRALMTVVEKDGKFFVSAEVPGIDVAERPCFYKGQGRLKGAYIRVGDSDERMSEYEVYSYESFRKKLQDDIRCVPRATQASLDEHLVQQYIQALRMGKPHFAAMDDATIKELMSITKNGEVTLSAVMLFCPYPQVYFPQLCITAISVPGTEMGELGADGERFLDNQRIEGNIPTMLNEAMAFVRRNMKTKTVIHEDTGLREDVTDYPMVAVREAVVNALVHRDYSAHTEGTPIQIVMYEDRIEIKNPGGLYGRITVDQLGKMQPDTRNPVLATALEMMSITENRYSGIPTIRMVMAQHCLKPPIFLDERGSFIVRFYKEKNDASNTLEMDEDAKKIVDFCKQPRTRKELLDFIGLTSASYAMRKYVTPLIEQGLIKMTIPEKPKSPHQQYYSEG